MRSLTVCSFAIVALLSASELGAQTPTYTLDELPGPALDVNESGTVVGFDASSGNAGYRWTVASGVQPMTNDANIAALFPIIKLFPRGLRISGGGSVAGLGRSAIFGPTGAALLDPPATYQFIGGEDPLAYATGVNERGQWSACCAVTRLFRSSGGPGVSKSHWPGSKRSTGLPTTSTILSKSSASVSAAGRARVPPLSGQHQQKSSLFRSSRHQQRRRIKHSPSTVSDMLSVDLRERRRHRGVCSFGRSKQV